MPDVSSTGQVLEKTTRTRIIADSQPPDFWSYIENLKLPDAEHLLYLYLQRDNRNIGYGTYTSHFTARDGHLVPIDDKEALENAIQAKFGGGMWRLILKKGKSRMCESRIFTGDGPTLPPPPTEPLAELAGNRQQNPSMFGPLPNYSDGTTAQLASKAIDTIAGQEHQAVNLGISMMTTAADTMKRFAERSSTDPAPATGPGAELTHALIQAALGRLNADPMQQLSQTIALVREMTGGSRPAESLGSRMEEVRSIMGFLREIGINNGGGSSSTGGEIVRTVAAIVPQAIDGIRATAEAWKAGKEADRDSIFMMQRAAGPPPGRPGIPPQNSPFNPPPRPDATPLPAAPAPNAEIFRAVTQSGAVASSPPGPPPGTELIEEKIMKIFNAPTSAEEAASRALEFLNVMSVDNGNLNYVNMLTAGGETGLVNVFHSRPVLAPATLPQNMPRLMEFIRAFLKFHSEDEIANAQESGAGKPN